MSGKRRSATRSTRLFAAVQAIATTRPPGMVTALYRTFDVGDHLLYLGIANNPRSRLMEHAAWSVWAPHVVRVAVEWFSTRVEAELAERQAISAHRPLFNSSHTDDRAHARIKELMAGVPIEEIFRRDEIERRRPRVAPVVTDPFVSRRRRAAKAMTDTPA